MRELRCVAHKFEPLLSLLFGRAGPPKMPDPYTQLDRLHLGRWPKSEESRFGVGLLAGRNGLSGLPLGQLVDGPLVEGEVAFSSLNGEALVQLG